MFFVIIAVTTYFYLPEEKPLAVIKYKIFSIFSFHCLTVLALLVSSVNNIQHVNLCDQLMKSFSKSHGSKVSNRRNRSQRGGV